MKTVNVRDDDPTLSALLRDLDAGEEVVLARDGLPVARLVRLPRPMSRKGLYGFAKDQVTVPDSFFDPLPEEELRAWEGGPIFPGGDK